VKFFLELGLFLLILSQISQLAHAVGTNGVPAPVTNQSVALAAARTIGMAPQEQGFVQLAQAQATQILETGEIDGFMNELDRAPLAKTVLGL